MGIVNSLHINHTIVFVAACATLVGCGGKSDSSAPSTEIVVETSPMPPSTPPTTPEQSDEIIAIEDETTNEASPSETPVVDLPAQRIRALRAGDSFSYDVKSETTSGDATPITLSAQADVSYSANVVESLDKPCILADRTVTLNDGASNETIYMPEAWHQDAEGNLSICGVWDQTARHSAQDSKHYVLLATESEPNKLMPLVTALLDEQEPMKSSGSFNLASGHFVSYTCTTVVGPSTQLTVPAGDFDAYPLRTTCNYDYQELLSEETHVRWWVPSVGIVKHDETIVEHLDAATVTHTRAYSLTAYALNDE